MACVQGCVEDGGEHRRQLVSAVLEGGWRYRVRPSCFARVLPLEKSVNFTLLNGESRHCGGEASLVGRCSSGQSNCLSNLQWNYLFQVVGQLGVVNCVGGSGLVVGDLPEPSPNRSSVVSREFVF